MAVAVRGSFSAPPAAAQELHQDLQGFWRAEVARILKEESRQIAGTETEALVQTLEARILESERQG